MSWSEDMGMDKPHLKRPLRVAVTRKPEGASDGFAPYHGVHRCLSPSGFWRPNHDFCVEKRDGLHCMICDKLLRYEDERRA